MTNDDATAAMFRAMRELVLTADADSLASAVEELGIAPSDLARSGRAAADHARASAAAEFHAADAGNLHDGLRALLQLLRRRDGLSYEQVAERARIDAEEIRSIEEDPTYTPRPRTIYQLAQYFNLPQRSLAKLAGMTQHQSSGFRDEVLRFAASSKAMHRLTRDETRVLNAFVKFLSKDADTEDE